jgi:hypothetical protein
MMAKHAAELSAPHGAIVLECPQLVQHATPRPTSLPLHENVKSPLDSPDDCSSELPNALRRHRVLVI